MIVPLLAAAPFNYLPIWKIIDERWESQLHRPLHAAAYYLNPHFHYESNFKIDDVEIKQGLYNCMARLVPDTIERNKISLQLPEFHYARCLFGVDTAKVGRKTMLPAKWWDFYGDGCPELKRFFIRILSLTCSSSGCERNLSAFEQVHTKKRIRLHQKKMNDLVYVMYNSKLKQKQIGRNLILNFEDIHSDDEWITEDGNDDVFEVEDENAHGQPSLEGDLGVGPSIELNVDEIDSSDLIGSSNNVEDLGVTTRSNDENVDAFVDDVLLSSNEEEDRDDDDDNEYVIGFEF